MGTDRQQGDRQDQQPRDDEHPGGNSYAEGVVVQPFLQHVPGDRDGNHKGDQYWPDEVFGEEDEDIGQVGPYDLADTYFFGSLVDDEGGEAEQTQAGDEDGEAGEDAEGLTELLVGFVLFGEMFVEKEIIKGVAGEELFPFLLDGCDDAGQGGGVTGQFEGVIGISVGDIAKDMGVVVLLQGFLVVVGDDADDGILFTPEVDALVEGGLGFGEAHFLHGGFIEEDGLGVDLSGVEISSLEEFQAIGVDEVVVNADDAVLVGFGDVVRNTFDATCVPSDFAAGYFCGDGHLFYAREAEGFGLEGGEPIIICRVEYAGAIEDEGLADPDAEVLVLHVMQLPVDGKSTGYQDDGGGELQYHEGLTKEGAMAGLGQFSFQHDDRPERGQDEGGIQAREKGADEEKTGEDEPEYGVAEKREMQFLPGKEVEEGDANQDDHKGQENGQSIDQHGFEEKLLDQLTAERAEDFPYTDFFGPFDGAGGGEVDIIDPGDDDDKACNDKQEIDGLAVAVGLSLEHIMGGEMNIGQGLQVDNHSVMRGLHLLAPFGLYHSGDLLFECGGVGAGADKDIIKESIPVPSGIYIRACPLHQCGPGQEDIEFQVGIGGRVFDDSGDAEVVFFVQAEHLPQRGFGAEIFAGGGFGDHGAEYVFQCAVRGACYCGV